MPGSAVYFFRTGLTERLQFHPVCVRMVPSQSGKLSVRESRILCQAIDLFSCVNVALHSFFHPTTCFLYS